MHIIVNSSFLKIHIQIGSVMNITFQYTWVEAVSVKMLNNESYDENIQKK
jgi:hypothetical protein